MDYTDFKVNEVISFIGSLIRTPLPEKATDLAIHLRTLESKRFILLETRVNVGQYLQEKKAQMLFPKSKDLTELDRRIRLNSSLAEVERDFEFLVGLEKLVAERLLLGRLLLFSPNHSGNSEGQDT